MNSVGKISISEAVEKSLKKKTAFAKLDYYDQRAVLRFLFVNKINIKVFGYKWFDVLTQRFYVENFKYENDEEEDIKTIKSFDNFDDFYEFVNGDIYTSSCFYGYVFNDAIVRQYGINLECINKKSFVNETISKYTFDFLRDKKSNALLPAANRAKEMMEWIDSCPDFSSVKELARDQKAFEKEFQVFRQNEVYFSTLLRKKGQKIKDVIVDYFCSIGTCFGFSIDDILVHYGREAAEYVVNNYVGQQSYNTQKKRIREFKKILEGYDHGPNSLKRKTFFDEDLQLYVVNDQYINGEYCSIIENYYFSELDEFAAFLSNDLCGADLRNAPIQKEDVLKYKTDDKTILPASSEYSEYVVVKEYRRKHFFVIQKWFDSDKKLVLSKKHSFDYVFDFIHFLKKDLSDADLIMCDGVEHLIAIPKLNLERIKVRSNVANELGAGIRHIPEERFKPVSFNNPVNYEISTIDTFLTQREEDEGSISYVTDLHLLHRFEANNAVSMEDCTYVTRKIAEIITDQTAKLCLIGGDVSSDFNVFKVFINNLKILNDKNNTFVFTLGNHELWDFEGKTIDEITKEYREFLDKHGMLLVQNSIVYLRNRKFYEMSEEELTMISKEDLREKMRDSNLVIFGGIGFSGKNPAFNANSGIYRKTLDREAEIRETNRFFSLYEKVTQSLYGRNVLILTHTPISDWGGDIKPQPGFIYVNGHNHRNYFEDDGKIRIFADNQVGYRGKLLNLKTISTYYSYDWFSDYTDGIYEITKKDYESFYRGIGEQLTFNRQFDKLFMVKRDGTYMFFMTGLGKNMQILNGGSLRKAGNHDLNYFFENISKYNRSINAFLENYYSFQKSISNEIKRIGGAGTIHGCIIDIDFLNHLYLNPIDGTITSYKAESMIEKHIYSNLLSLLKNECPKLYKRYNELSTSCSVDNSLMLYSKAEKISNLTIYEESTEMYRISRTLKGLQYALKYNVIRIWSDSFIENDSKESGRLIISNIINSDQ